MPNVPFSTIDFPPETGTSQAAQQVPPEVPSLIFPEVDFADEPGGAYWGFGLSIEYQWHSGLACAPLASSRRGQCAFWRRSNEFATKIITFVAARMGNQPTLPHFDTDSDNDVLLSRIISVPTPGDLPDGSRCIIIAGQYIYGMQMAPDLLDPILVPNSVLRAPAYIQLYPSQFTHLLCGPATAPAEFNGNVVNY